MSPTIWTQCAERCRPRPKVFAGFRVVESQFITSTLKLVDSLSEQGVIEGLIDRAKPPLPVGLEKLHYLLSTPFRHPPLRNGSRFGRRTERGIFYGSLAVSVALAEVAYYRLVFLEGTRAELGRLQTEHSAFPVNVKARRFADLTRPPFDAFESRLASKTDYTDCQALGTDLRAAHLDAFVFRSARDPQGSKNFALLTPAFGAAPRESQFQGFICVASRERVEFREKTLRLAPQTFSFAREVFLVNERIPTPAV